MALLQRHEIKAVADIRRFAGSRKWPHFNREPLATALREHGIEYHWLESLGGRRKKQSNSGSSPNWGLHNESFRNYADYMLTGEFRHGITELLEIARRRRTTIMCAESVFWRCHRRLVSDYLIAQGVTVQDIFPNGETKPHDRTKGAKADSGQVTYPPEKSLFDGDHSTPIRNPSAAESR